MTFVTTARYTESDYMRLPEGFPAQLIDGMLVKEPSPTLWHQQLVLRLARSLCDELGERRVVISPIDVFIDRFNVLQPDVVVLPEDTPSGPGLTRIPIPILAVEVFSPTSRRRDRGIKTPSYLRAGVREVWLVDPESESVEIVTASGATAVSEGVARAKTLPFSVELGGLFRTG